MEKVLSAAHHLLQLISDILDVSKIEAGKIELFLEEISLTKFIQEVDDIIKPMMKKNNNKCLWIMDDNIGTMYSDFTRIKQSILNLVSNASKFTKDGTVTLQVERIISDGREWIRFQVKDTGIGMTQEQIGKLFHAFTQADASTTKKYGGTGLGLYLTNRFCQILEGTISVESEYNKGTTFTITLPAVFPAAKQTPVAASPLSFNQQRMGHKEYVLIIDDSPEQHEIMRILLNKAGYNALHAYNGKEGIEMARKHHPLAITLDVVMPNMDGWTVLNAIKADPQLKDIPVIVTSNVIDKNMGFTLGADDYLSKPIHSHTLINSISRFVKTEKGACALVVDDDPAARESIGRELKKLGWSILEAENGIKALECLQQQQPNIILLDLLMPKMNGFEVLKELRNNRIWRQIPVIVITAKSLSDKDKQYLLDKEAKLFTKDQLDIGNEFITQIKKAISKENHAVID